MPTASLIKFAVLIETYQQADEGKFKLTDKVTLHDSDKVPGSGILTDHFSDGATVLAPRRRAADDRRVRQHGDEPGAGQDRHRATSTSAWRHGAVPTRKINAKVFRGSTTSVDPERTKQYGLGSTTAREMVELLEEMPDAATLVGPALQADACWTT